MNRFPANPSSSFDKIEITTVQWWKCFNEQMNLATIQKQTSTPNIWM